MIPRSCKYYTIGTKVIPSTKLHGKRQITRYSRLLSTITPRNDTVHVPSTHLNEVESSCSIRGSKRHQNALLSTTQDCKLYSSSQDSDSSTSLPDAPSNMCCMSGCANCVWLDYTDDMIKAYAKKGEKLDLKVILQEIDDNVSDPMIKSFIKMELKTKFKDSKKL